MLSVVLVHKGIKVPVVVADGEALREKVAEATMVRKEDQKLVLNGHLIRCDSDLPKFYNASAPFNNVYVLGKSSAMKSISGYEPTACDLMLTKEDSAELAGLDWNETCSRVVNSSPLFQPFYSCRGKPVCTCCATLCHGHESPSLVPEIGPGLCRCCELGECLFAESYAAHERSRCLDVKHFENALVLSAYNCRGCSPKYESLKRQISGMCFQVSRYEDGPTQAAALSVVPSEEIVNLTDQMAFEKGVGPNDARICAYLRWFKDSFFSWVNAPPCARCSGPTKNYGSAEPTQEEREDGAGRVELYSCEKCPGVITRFPRYNNPRTLLRTRRGRCGEWANVSSSTHAHA